MVKLLPFKKARNKLEGLVDGSIKIEPTLADNICVKCVSCNKMSLTSELEENFHVCPKCGNHFRLSAKKRIDLMTDEDSFSPVFQNVTSLDPLEFPAYKSKLDALNAEGFEHEGVLCGSAKINGCPCMIFAMEPDFLMGSMGTVVGDKITALFELSEKNSLPVVGFSISGGARMQEGIFSLMQMAKTAAAVKRHSNAGNLFISVMCDPTTGGVTASFASLGDIIFAEPNALICFAGPRVIDFRIYAYHIHSGAKCTGNAEDPFKDTLQHFNPQNNGHPYHAGDLPPLFGNYGFAWNAVFTARFKISEVIGKTIVIHANPDDFITQPSGNSGTKIACGVIEANF